ncbi:hypothetical protein SeLEV6574_g01792 [Synchytrium endobioticum]|uniref:Uncharacterized protein n=1 Tax=Synchytrium endobioticum TaxID=286115 RepID=A0A507DBX0_9FUNG|nr:hypothetical protein SeLEV6574_g01792 [Synchytrium endobioticum]
MVVTDPEFSSEAALALRRVYPILAPDDVLLETPTFRAGSAWDRPDEFQPPTNTHNYILSSQEYKAGGELGPRTCLYLNLAHTLWAFDSFEQALRFHRDHADTIAGNHANKLEELSTVTLSPADKLSPQNVPPTLRVGDEAKLYVGLSTSAEEIPKRQRASVWSTIYIFVCENTLHRLELTKIGRGAAIAKGIESHGSAAALHYFHSEDGVTDLRLVGRLVRVLEGRTVEMVELGLVHGPRRFSDAVRECVPSMRTWANDWERHVTKTAPKPVNPAILFAKAKKIIGDLKSGKPAMMVAALHWEEIDPAMEQFVRHGGIEAVVDLLLSHPLNSERPKDLQRVLGSRGGICMQASIVLGLALREPAGAKYYPGRAVLSKLITMFCRGDVGETMAALHVLADLCAGPPPPEPTQSGGIHSKIPLPPKKDPTAMTQVAESVWVIAGMSILCRMGDLYRTFGDLENLRDDHGFYAAMEDLLASFSSGLISWEPEPGVAGDFACHGDQTYVLGHCVSGGLDASHHLFQLWATAHDDIGRSSKIPPLTELCSRISLICEGLPSVAEQLRGYRRWQDVRRLVTAVASPELTVVQGWKDLWGAFADLCARAGGLPKGGVEEARRLRGIGISSAKNRTVKEASLVDVDDASVVSSEKGNNNSELYGNTSVSSHHDKAPAGSTSNTSSGKKRAGSKRIAPRTSSIIHETESQTSSRLERTIDGSTSRMFRSPVPRATAFPAAQTTEPVELKQSPTRHNNYDGESVVRNSHPKFNSLEQSDMQPVRHKYVAEEELQKEVGLDGGRTSNSHIYTNSNGTRESNKDEDTLVSLATNNRKTKGMVPQAVLELADVFGGPSVDATISCEVLPDGKQVDRINNAESVSNTIRSPTSPKTTMQTPPLLPLTAPQSPGFSGNLGPVSGRNTLHSSPQSAKSPRKSTSTKALIPDDGDDQWEEDTPKLSIALRSKKSTKKFPVRTTSIPAKLRKGGKAITAVSKRKSNVVSPPVTPPSDEAFVILEDDGDETQGAISSQAESLADFDPLFATERRKRDGMRKAQLEKEAEERCVCEEGE